MPLQRGDVINVEAARLLVNRIKQIYRPKHIRLYHFIELLTGEDASKIIAMTPRNAEKSVGPDRVIVLRWPGVKKLFAGEMEGYIANRLKGGNKNGQEG